MERSIIFAGFGGQGILFAGKVLARAAMNEDLEVLWIPSYGPEMRGGTASCTVILGSDPIGSPIVDQADRRPQPTVLREVRVTRRSRRPAGAE